MSRRRVYNWILEVTRPALKPLALSVSARLLDQILQVVIYSLGAYALAVALRKLSGGGGLDTGLVWLFLLACLIIALVKAALRYAEQFLGHLVAFKALELLRIALFKSMLPQSPRLSLHTRSAELTGRLTKDIDRIEVFFAHTLAPLVSSLVVPLLTWVWIAFVSPATVSIFVLVMLALTLVMVPLMGAKFSLAGAQKSAKIRGQLQAHVTDSVQGYNEVLSYGAQLQRLEQLERIGDSITAADAPVRAWAALRWAAGQLLMALMLFGVLFIWLRDPVFEAAPLAQAPTVVAVIAALVAQRTSARTLEDMPSSVSVAWASAERVYATAHGPALLDGPKALPAHRDDAAKSGLEVTWHKVSYAYPGERKHQALTQVSLHLNAGSWTVLAGASGSGKSTLSMLAARCDDPVGGRVLLDGHDVRTLKVDSLRSQVQLVSQHPFIMRATIRENLALAAPQADTAQLWQALEYAQLAAEVRAMPKGLDTLVGERGSSLSGGQAQRLAFARALVAKPRLLILDEFTSHMDLKLAASVRKSLRQALPEATILEVSHTLVGLELADRVVVFENGQIVQSGKPQKLMNTPGPLRQLMDR